MLKLKVNDIEVEVEEGLTELQSCEKAALEIPRFKQKLDLAIFASGKGSNFNKIMLDVSNNILDANIKCLIVNNPDCGAIEVAKNHLVPYNILNNKNY